MANPTGVRIIFWSASRLLGSHTFEMSKVGLVVYMVGVLDRHFDGWLWDCLLLYGLYIRKGGSLRPVSSTAHFCHAAKAKIFGAG